MSYETQSGINCLLASTLRGRKTLLHRKIGIAGILTTVIWAVTYGLEFYAFLGVADITSLAAPVQNLSLLEKFPLSCSVGVFFFGLYLFRRLALFTCAMLTMLISSYMKRLETAYIAASGVILLPSVLYLFMGLKPLKYLPLALEIEGIPMLEPNGSILQLFIHITLLFAVISLCVYGLSRKMQVQKCSVRVCTRK